MDIKAAAKTVVANRAKIAKRALIVAGSAAGLILTAVILSAVKNPDVIEAVESAPVE